MYREDRFSAVLYSTMFCSSRVVPVASAVTHENSGWKHNNEGVGVPETPSAGVANADLLGPSRPSTELQRTGNINSSLKPGVRFWFFYDVQQ